MQIQSSTLHEPCRRCLMQLAMLYCRHKRLGAHVWLSCNHLLMQSGPDKQGGELRRHWHRRPRAKPLRDCTPWLL